MNTFGGIVEGKTDFPIINSVLIGYFRSHDIKAQYDENELDMDDFKMEKQIVR